MLYEHSCLQTYHFAAKRRFNGKEAVFTCNVYEAAGKIQMAAM